MENAFWKVQAAARLCAGVGVTVLTCRAVFLTSTRDVYTEEVWTLGNVLLNSVTQRQARGRACRRVATRRVGDHHLLSGPRGAEDTEQGRCAAVCQEESLLNKHCSDVQRQILF